MANLRLVRKSSDKPNISNRDDAVMVRYAYGGYDGIVKNFARELSLSHSAAWKVHLFSGKAVLQGWEIEVEEQDIALTSFSGQTQYEHLYIELNLLLESVTLKTIRHSSSVFPASLGLGDDLTQAPTGTARLPLYYWTISSTGDVSGITRHCPIIRHGKSHFDEIYDRLERLGFREGSVIVPDGVSVQENFLKREGNYVIGEYLCAASREFPKLSDTKWLLGTVPKEFRFTEVIRLWASLEYSGYDMVSGALHNIVYINPDGTIVITGSSTLKYHRAYIQIGYEATPL